MHKTSQKCPCQKKIQKKQTQQNLCVLLNAPFPPNQFPFPPFQNPRLPHQCVRTKPGKFQETEGAACSFNPSGPSYPVGTC